MFGLRLDQVGVVQVALHNTNVRVHRGYQGRFASIPYQASDLVFAGHRDAGQYFATDVACGTCPVSSLFSQLYSASVAIGQAPFIESRELPEAGHVVLTKIF